MLIKRLGTSFSGMTVVLVLTAAVAACDKSVAPFRSPSAPSPVPQAAPAPPAPPQMTLRGSVTDTAFRPLQGVLLEIVDGPQTGIVATSDASGQFSFGGTFDDTTRVRASRADYVTSISAIAPSCATCSPGNRWVYFYLAVLAPPVSIAGDYTLTFVADSTCSLPPDMRTRTYSATITERVDAHNPPGTIFTATLGGTQFLRGYDSMWIGVAGDFVTFGFGGHGPGVVEQLAPNTYLSFDGSVQTSIGSSRLSSISMHFDGAIEYCERKSPLGEWYECPPTQATTASQCRSKTHQFILTRR